MESMMKYSFATLVAAAMAAPAVTSSAQSVLFDFNNGGVVGAAPATFDGGGGLRNVGTIAAVASFEDPAVVLALELTDIFSPEFVAGPDGGPDFVLTGNTLSAAAGDTGLEVNINTSNSLGVANPTIPNGFIGNETDVFNGGDGITFTFDSAVEFTAIELEFGGSDSIFEVLVNGAAVLTGPANSGSGGFIDLGGLTGLEIAEGAEITFAVNGPIATQVGVETFTVSVVPEPASLALMGLGGLAICARRKRG